MRGRSLEVLPFKALAVPANSAILDDTDDDLDLRGPPAVAVSAAHPVHALEEVLALRPGMRMEMSYNLKARAPDHELLNPMFDVRLPGDAVLVAFRGLHRHGVFDPELSSTAESYENTQGLFGIHFRRGGRH